MRRRWIAAIVVLLLATVGGALLWQRFASDHAVRPRLVATLSRQTGRPVAIGHAGLRLLPSPHLLVDDVAIGNMLRIAHLRATIRVWPLLSHVVRVRALVLDGVSLHLRRGQDDWRAAHASGSTGAGHSGGRRWRLQLDSLVSHDSEIDWHEGQASGVVHLSLLRASGLDGASPRFRLAGAAHGAGYGIEGKARRVADRSPWAISLQARETIGGAVVAHGRLSGTIASRHDYDLAGALTLADLAALDRLFPNAKLPAAKAVSVDLHVRDDGHPALLALRAHGGAVSLPASDGVTLRGWRIKAAAPGAPVQVAANGAWQGSAVYLSGTLGTLRTLGDGGLNAVARHSLLPLLQALAADLVLQSGGTDSARLRVGGGAIPVAWRLSLHPWSMPAASLSRLLGSPDAVHGKAELVGELDTSGERRAALRASAHGHLGVSVVGGTISNAVLAGVLGPDSAINAMLPRRGGVALRCLALHATIGHGQAAFDTIDLQTAPVSLRGHGSLALGGGDLDLHLWAVARVGAAAATVPVTLRGSLRHPTVAMERAAPGGRYVLSLGPRESGGEGCQAALLQAREGLAGEMPAPLRKPEHSALGILRALGLAH
ncbi:AsmA family protein [Lichenicoccus sp.]|uniref:AsmA family protein n=1 Tax=Lichenicoccus sp. TaxID=2781899 RepID=UPI003D1116E2